MNQPEAISVWRLERGPDGRLDFVDAAAVRHVDVNVLRAFPLSDPDGGVSILSAEGHELAWIDSLAALPPGERSLVESELSVREFLPVVESIESISHGEPAHWQVRTDRGPRGFTTANADPIERRHDGSIVITDTHGIRFLIRSRSALDSKSRRLLDKCL